VRFSFANTLSSLGTSIIGRSYLPYLKYIVDSNYILYLKHIALCGLATDPIPEA
jgi:hypothetical protein